MQHKTLNQPKSVNWGGRALRLLVAFTLLFVVVAAACAPGAAPQLDTAAGLQADGTQVAYFISGDWYPQPEVNWNS